MTRPMKLKARRDLITWLGWLVACTFVALSGALSVVYAIKLGAETGFAWVLVTFAVAFQLATAIVPARTFGRGYVITGLLAFALVVLPCMIYSWGAAYDFARSNFQTAETKRSVNATEYAAQRSHIDRLRAQIEPVARADDPAVARQAVDVEIWRRTSGCQDVTIAESKAACAPYTRAKTLQRLQGELATALAALNDMTTASAAGADGGPALALANLIAGAFGLKIKDWGELMALVMVIAGEGGCVLLPLAMAVATRERRRPEPRAPARIWPVGAHAPEFLQTSGPGVASGYVEHVPEAVTIVRQWAARRVVDAPGAEEKGQALFEDYCAYCAAINEEPINYQYFGTILTQAMKWEKAKRGVVYRVGVRLAQRGRVHQPQEVAA